MAGGLWQIEHGRGVNFGSLCGVLQVSLEVTSVTTYRTRHLYDGVLLVIYVAALVASGSRAPPSWSVATRACHVNHAGVTKVNINTYKFTCTRAPRILVMNKFISVRYEMRPNFAAQYLGPGTE